MTTDSETPSTVAIKTGCQKIAVLFSIIALLLACAALFFAAKNYRADNSALEQTHKTTQQLQTLQQNVLQYQERTQHNAAQTQYWLQLANQQLYILHDPSAALKTVYHAQKTLPENNTAAQQAITTAIATLEPITKIKSQELFSQLMSVMQAVQTLSAIPKLSTASTSAKNTGTITTAHPSLSQKILRIFQPIRNLFIVRHLNHTQTLPLDAQSEFDVKQNILLQLSLTQWAILQRNNVLYQSTLRNVEQLLKRYFSLSDGTAALLIILHQLQTTNIQVPENILHDALAAMRHAKKTTPRDNA